MENELQWFFVKTIHAWQPRQWITATVEIPPDLIQAWQAGTEGAPSVALLIEAGAQVAGILQTISHRQVRWVVMAKVSHARIRRPRLGDGPFTLRADCLDESETGARFQVDVGNLEQPDATIEMILGFGAPPGAEQLSAPFRETWQELLTRFNIELDDRARRQLGREDHQKA